MKVFWSLFQWFRSNNQHETWGEFTASCSTIKLPLVHDDYVIAGCPLSSNVFEAEIWCDISKNMNCAKLESVCCITERILCSIYVNTLLNTAPGSNVSAKRFANSILLHNYLSLHCVGPGIWSRFYQLQATIMLRFVILLDWSALHMYWNKHKWGDTDC